MTSLEARAPYSNQELAELYPAHLELQQVQILLRHGERTPVNARFMNAGLSPFWPYCKAANSLKSAVLAADQQWDTLAWKRRLESFGEEDMPKLNAGANGEVDAVCQPGELTDRGRETTLALGQRIRRLYIDQLGFLGPTLDANTAKSINLRSTPIPRALESVQQAFTGLYPASVRATGLAPPTIVSRAMQYETLFPNEGACKRFAELAHAFADRTAQLYNGGPELDFINKKIGKYMPKESSVIKVDSHPRLSGILDTVNSTLAHGKGTRLPSEFYDPKVRANVDRICTEEWFIGYQESNEYRKLGIGSLVGDLTQRMVEHTRGLSSGTNTSDEGGFKMSLAGCHDTTIAATLTALGAFEVEKDSWPRYTSSIAFELFKKKNSDPIPSADTSTSGAIWPEKEKTWWSSIFPFSSSRASSASTTFARAPLATFADSEKAKLDSYFVRLRYNDRAVSLPFCKDPTRHLDDDETFCTLAAFKEAADTFTPRNWKAECSANLGKAAMGEGKIEKPPGVL